MGVFMNSLVKNVVEFIDVLRQACVRISISESIDAVDALKHVNPIDRNEVKIAMSACLAKGEEERKVFSEAFDRFFIIPGSRSEYINKRTQEIEQKKKEIMEEVSELKFQDEQIDISDDLKEVYAGLPDEEKKSIRDFLQKTSTGKNVRPEFKPVAESMVRGRLNNLKQKLAGAPGMPFQGILAQVPSEAGIIAGDVMENIREESSLLYKNIGDIRDEDIPRVIKLIRIIVERLKRNISRRYKKTNKKARLDLKKTIRSNLSTGGVQFRLKYKKRPKRKEKFLVLCDVSASMYRFSGFVLQFVLGMHSGVSSADSFIFSEEVEHLNMHEFINAAGFEDRIKRSPVWRRGTNINRAFSHILHERKVTINSSTIVLVVSDAKTLDADKAVKSLKALKSKVKKILWMNPVPETDWDRNKSTGGFREHCTMLDCSTLERLAGVCGRL